MAISLVILGCVLHGLPDSRVGMEVYINLALPKMLLDADMRPTIMEPPFFDGKSCPALAETIARFDSTLLQQPGAEGFKSRVLKTALCRLQAHIQQELSTDPYDLFMGAIKLGAPVLLHEAMTLIGHDKSNFTRTLKTEKSKAAEKGWTVFDDEVDRGPNRPKTVLTWISLEHFKDWLKHSSQKSKNRPRLLKAWQTFGPIGPS